MKGGVSCWGSPIDSLISPKVGAGDTPANSWRSFSKG
jgi:hypothetical protein